MVSDGFEKALLGLNNKGKKTEVSALLLRGLQRSIMCGTTLLEALGKD